MTDFLGNLIMRSTGGQTNLPVLQPRLPSLYEPVSSGSEIQALVPEPVEQERIASPHRPVSAPLRNDITVPRPAVPGSGERERPPEPDRNRISVSDLPRPQPDLAPGMEFVSPMPPGPPSSKESRPAASSFLPEAPVRTITPSLDNQATPKVRTKAEDRITAASPERSEHRELQPLAIQAGSPGRLLLQDAPEMEPVQVAVQIIKEESSREDAAPSVAGPVLVNLENKPAAVLRPALPGRHQVHIPQIEPAQVQSPQQVVEIHIGRVEVRAEPAPSTSKRSSPKRTMSLEEYLRSRPGGKS